MSHQIPLLWSVKLNNIERRLNNRNGYHPQMIPLDLAGEASETATSAGVAVTDASAGIGDAGIDGAGIGGAVIDDAGIGDAGIGGAGSLSAFEVGGSTGAKSSEDENLCA